MGHTREGHAGGGQNTCKGPEIRRGLASFRKWEGRRKEGVRGREEENDIREVAGARQRRCGFYYQGQGGYWEVWHRGGLI